MLDSLILLAVTFLAVMISSMSGGGSTMITAPVMLSMGIPYPLVASTGSLTSAFWVIPAGYNYLKGRKVDWRFVAVFSLLGLAGAYLGFLTVMSIKPEIIKPVVGAIILALVAYTLLHKGFGEAAHAIRSRWQRKSAYFFAPLMGFYEIFFGAGNGVFFAALTAYTRGYDFIMALGCYYAVAFVWLVFSVGLFLGQGLFSWALFLPCVIGSVAGAYAGSRFARYKGNKFVKIVFVTVGGILGLKLLLGL
jgi:uncharacterized membrane protein YfcA